MAPLSYPFSRQFLHTSSSPYYMMAATFLKQCLFSRATRLVVIAALVLSLIITYATDIWKVEVEYKLPGKVRVNLTERVPALPREAPLQEAGRDNNGTDYDWDEDKLRKEAGDGKKDNESFDFLDKIIDKLAPTLRVTRGKNVTKKADVKVTAAKERKPKPTTQTPKKTTPKPKLDDDSHLQRIVPRLPTFHAENANCAKLIVNDKDAMAAAGKYQRQNNKVTIPDYHYITATKNCDKFKEERQYVEEPLSSEEAEFPLAFSVLIYKDIEQFERLLRAIYRPQNYYCVHVDIKSKPDVKKAAAGIADCFDNVFISSQSFDVEWGAYSILQPELACMEDLWKYKTWKYFINLTGQEFPLQTMWDIVKILKVYNGANNMEGTIKRRNTGRTEYVHNGYFATDVKKSPCPVNVTITKGSVHITASRAYIDYVLHDKQALQFRDWVNDTGVPDETFFSSLNFSPQLGVPGSYKGEPETDKKRNLFITRYKNWGTYPFDWPCEGQRVRMICIHGIGDLPMLASRKELFTNKFHLDYNPLALDCLEELVLNRTRDEVLGRRKFKTDFYETLDYVRNHV